MSCRYYGRASVEFLKALVATGGNQCAQIDTAHSPCQMEIRGDVPDWETCPLNNDSFHAHRLAGYHLTQLEFAGAPAELRVAIGGRVKISGHAGDVIGTVEADTTPEELPAIAGAPPVEQVRGICREYQYNRLLALSYNYGSLPVIFMAVSRDGARWFDLRGQALEIVPQSTEAPAR